MTTDNVGSLNHDNLIYPILWFYNILEFKFLPFFIETFSTQDKFRKYFTFLNDLKFVFYIL